MRTWTEVLRERLTGNAQEAAEYLRATLEESDSRMLAHAVRNVLNARGSLDGLGLSQDELLAMIQVLSNQAVQLPQAA